MVQNQSIYEPPKSSLETNHEGNIENRPASKWQRFFNLVIDYFAFTFFALLLGFFVGLVFGDKGVQFLESIGDFVLGVTIVFLYYAVLEFLTGRTLGKLITGTKVVSASGFDPTFRQILGRSMARIIPFEAFSFLGKKGSGWHDTLSSTYVVKTR